MSDTQVFWFTFFWMMFIVGVLLKAYEIESKARSDE